jgi:hypothetical protein
MKASHSFRPRPATVLAFIALMVALGGTALAATGTVVNIGDGTTAGHLAKVSSGGKLSVGDGSGNLTVDGRVGDAAPATAFRSAGFTSGNTCVPVATAPADKALVITDINLDVYTPAGDPAFANFYLAAGGCTTFLTAVDFSARGPQALQFQSGVIVPPGQALSIQSASTVYALATGYSVSPGSVPAAGTTIAPKAAGRGAMRSR